MSERVAVRFEDVGKRYKLYGSAKELAFDQLGLYRLRFWRPRPSYQEFEALQGLSFEILHGERWGIVGRNGAGKTTLLRLITQNFAPTRGRVVVRGSVQALMQMGLGFNPDFSGLENIRAALAYNGLLGRAYRSAVDEVVDFVELGEFLDQPVRTYSLGMQARLQFATATAVRPDILILDEVLGAGDGYFATKCAERMKRLTESGCTLLLVSHSSQQVLQFCERALWLESGRLRASGPASQILEEYEGSFEGEREGPTDPSRGPRGGRGPAGPSGPDEDELAAGRRLRRLRRMLAVPPDFRRPFVVGAVRESEPIEAGGRPERVLLHGIAEVDRWPGSAEVELKSLVLHSRGEPLDRVRTGEHASVSLRLRVRAEGPLSLRYAVLLFGLNGRLRARAISPIDRFQGIPGAEREVELALEQLTLGTGDYVLSAGVFCAEEGSAPEASLRPEARVDYLSQALCVRVPAANECDPPLLHWPGRWFLGDDSEPQPGRVSGTN